MKILIVRAEEGKITESEIVEGDFRRVLRQTVEKAFSEWDESKSDFLVVRDEQEIEVDASDIESSELEEIARITEVRRERSGFKIKIPIYMISFDNRIEGDSYIDSRIYVVVPLVNEGLKDIIEADAAHYTAPEKPQPRGIKDLEA